uniref:hypothetical protein n=1 Tax=Microbacterium sp. TaxID=51671 RepID=UPI002FE0BA35
MHVNWGIRRVDASAGNRDRRPRTMSRWAGIATALALSIGALAVPAVAAAETAPAAGTPETYTADGLPTVQIDGVVYAQEVVGN